MFVSPTVRFPCHGSGSNKTHFRDDQYLAAAAAAALYGCENPGYFGSDTANSLGFASVAAVAVPPPPPPFLPSSILASQSQSQAHAHGFRLHPRWRAIMGEDAWYQSISDYEEENYFNSPHLQHPRHSTVLAKKDERDLPSSHKSATTMGMTDARTTTTTAHQSHHPTGVIDAEHDSDPHIWSDSRASIASETATLHSNNNSITTWHDHADQGQTAILPSQPPLNTLHRPSIDEPAANEEEPEEIFGDIDINRDMETLVKAPLGFDGLPRSPPVPPPQGLTVRSQRSHRSLSSGSWLQEIVHPADTQYQGAYSMSPSSPMMSITSQEDMSSCTHSPYRSVYDHAATETTCESYLQVSSPTKRESRQFPMQKVRKSLPNSPMRPRASATHGTPYPTSSSSRSASFEEFSLRGRSPANRDGLFNSSSMRVRRREVSVPMSTDERAEKDEFLVKSRRKGMSYRDIKREGGFSEAESTLRGRYRMLTKSREERVRNPQWTPVDVVLLRKAVLQYCKGKNPLAVRIPWKEIARFIIDHGGTYHFGNATCRKKWDELTALGFDQEIEDDEDDDVEGEEHEEEEYEDEGKGGYYE
ncbi:hypothetical protein PT974_08104 [Cladobotryum mycophilum]|uniref:Myb-like domain-containing protein n=1 Tax=Cladobotryum mycophilum TaxID=491253 RepID=A0ABR0SCF0_9HYPO